jgi:hypothetical protein
MWHYVKFKVVHWEHGKRKASSATIPFHTVHTGGQDQESSERPGIQVVLDDTHQKIMEANEKTKIESEKIYSTGRLGKENTPFVIIIVIFYSKSTKICQLQQIYILFLPGHSCTETLCYSWLGEVG